MSIPVELSALAAEVERFGPAPYVLTVDGEGRPHAVACQVGWRRNVLVTRVGRGSTANAAGRSLVSLLWPPFEPGGYSLIVDATAAVVESEVVLTPTKAVLHRSGPPGPTAASGCGSDCVRVA